MDERRPSSVAIALATFNGERYLDAQLDSLVSQTRRPDMVSIVDDASSDSTVDVLRQFAARAPFRVEVVRHAERLGATGTFQDAVKGCEGDVIFLCDQDDVWYERKIERTLGVLSPQRGLAFCNADLVNEDLTKRGQTLFDSIGVTARESDDVARTADAFDLLMKRNLCWGTAMAFRESYRNTILPLPMGLGHDTWIFLVISMLAPVGIVDEPMFMYRQHSRQMYGAGKATHTVAERIASTTSSAQRYQQKLLATWTDLRRALSAVPDMPAHRLRVIDERLQHLAARGGLPASRLGRTLPVLREFLSGRYGRFSNGARSAMLDLVG